MATIVFYCLARVEADESEEGALRQCLVTNLILDEFMVTDVSIHKTCETLTNSPVCKRAKESEEEV